MYCKCQKACMGMIHSDLGYQYQSSLVKDRERREVQDSNGIDNILCILLFIYSFAYLLKWFWEVLAFTIQLSLVSHSLSPHDSASQTLGLQICSTKSVFLCFKIRRVAKKTQKLLELFNLRCRYLSNCTLVSVFFVELQYLKIERKILRKRKQLAWKVDLNFFLSVSWGPAVYEAFTGQLWSIHWKE